MAAATLWWIHGDRETRLPWSPHLRRNQMNLPSVPGSLLPPVQ